MVTEDLNLMISHHHYFDFPIIRKDFENWEQVGNTVIHKNKVILAPEAKDRKGIFYAKNPNPFPNAWIAEFEVHIGNKENFNKPAGIFGLYYLRDIEKVSHEDSVVGYSNRFDGLAVFLNTNYQRNIKDNQYA